MHDEDYLNRFKTPHDDPVPDWMRGDKWSDEEIIKITANGRTLHISEPVARPILNARISNDPS